MTYIVKRHETLQSGLRLVEIDYFHETRPLLKLLPSYPDREPGAYPYIILVSDPRPTLERGKTLYYDFGVDDSMPIVSVPLAGGDNFLLNFGEVYNRTFSASRLFQSNVDYARDPVQFDRYTEADRERIRQRISAIKQQSA